MNKSNKWQYVIVLLILLAVILIGWVASESAKARKIAQTTTPTFDNWIETPSLPESDDSTATFTTPHPILSNVLVRRAMAYCTNKAALVQAVYPWMSGEQAEGLAINTFITKDAPYYPGDENITIYKYDPAKGQMLLDEAGWRKVKGSDYRVNASGDELTLKLTTTNSEFRQAWTAVWEVQMKQCGIRINRLHAPASWWFGDATGLARRDFEAGAFAWVEQPDPGGYTLWACDQIPTPQNYWLGQNYMGWCNKEADKAIKQAVNTLDFETRKEAYKIVQQEYTRDVPAIPLFKRVVIFSAVADLSGFTPTPGEIYYLYNAYQWERPTTDTIVIGFTQEPASLYLPVEKTTVASLAMYLVNPSPYLTLNYEFSPQLIETISTFESGLARNEVVIVKIGDRVVDASGEVVILEKGMEVIDATGTEVKVGDIPIQMHQLVVTYKWRNDLTWSDGVKLGIEDFKLAYTTVCNRN
ncbi:MAG TPA: ABC transporter substrate-binding protein, partial [Anaerolineaceae bacterium]|nr:ABC transporter substrate-binding protein [Anaerolineaceae bacterium]